jgi:hypothetical protein
MKLLYVDSIGGASGDMVLALLCGLGLDPVSLAQELRQLPVGDFALRTETVSDRSIQGLRLFVDTHEHHPPHRTFADIARMISGSPLPEAVKASSLRVFRSLAVAEARVHGTTPEQVHFHEVGALDSILDIVGSCLGFHRLGIEALAVAPLPLGHGTIRSAHGILPVPAPATVELMAGHPVAATDEPYELVTPTGAALLMTLKTHPTLPPGCVLQRTAYAVGHRTLDHTPNLLRGMLMTAADPANQPESDTCTVLECNLDDTIPELIGSLSRSLLEAGALDAFTTAIQMKKQRPGTLLTVLCRPPDRDRLVDLIFRESTTFGIREYPARRSILQRRHQVVTTPFGDVRVKIGTWQGKDITRSPEHEDCVKLAQVSGQPVRTVYEAAQAASRQMHV